MVKGVIEHIPAGTPREVLVRVNAEVARAVRMPELRKRFLELGVELTASPSPEVFGAYIIKAEFEKRRNSRARPESGWSRSAALAPLATIERRLQGDVEGEGEYSLSC